MSNLRLLVQNFQENELVNYSLVLIKGCVLTNDGELSNSEEVIICETNHGAFTWPLNKGIFKCLAQLSRGENQVVLNYKGNVEKIKIRYEPRETDLCVTPVYVICEGEEGRFQAPEGCDNSVASACDRIALGARLVQCIFAEKLMEKGYGRKTFQLEEDLDRNAPGCRVLRCSLHVEEARKMNQEALWEAVGRDLLSSELGDQSRKFLAVMACTLWDGSKALADAALGSGGLALLGSGCLHTWPSSLSHVVKCFTDTTKLGSELLDNSCYRGTYGGCLSTTLGGACHEMGHTLGLGHPSMGIMSRGFDNMHRVLLASRATPAIVQPTGTPPPVTVTIIPEIRILQISESEGQRSRDRSPSRPRQKEINANLEEESDMTSWSPGCAAILARHRWLNLPSPPSTITYDPARRLVQGEAGLRVVQVRTECGAVVRSWELAGSSTLILPRLSASSLFAIDTHGTILTQPL